MIPKVGQKVKIQFGNDEPDIGTITYVEDYADSVGEHMTHIELDNGSRYDLYDRVRDEMVTIIEDMCSCYHESDRYKPFASGVCYGTKEQDPCTCKGDKNECDLDKQKGKTEVSKDYILNMSSKDKVTLTPIVNIRKIIDDSMEKKDRAVHILITSTGTSVEVIPYSNETPRWIFDRDYCTYECSECHNTNAYPAPYCPECGEKLAAAKEDKDGKN